MLLSIFGFFIAISILVSIHEYGHLWMAQRFGVKIVRFSLGFGKPLLRKVSKKTGITYTLSPIPLGGFVQMYGESGEQEIPDGMRHLTFSAKPAWQRLLIAFAGPLINLVFAVFVFTLLFVAGVEGIRPEVVAIRDNTPAAQTSLRSGDVITYVNGTETVFARDVTLALIDNSYKVIPIDYKHNGKRNQTILDLSTIRSGDEHNIGHALGLYLADNWWPAIIKKVSDDSAAKKMGLQADDEIIAIDNTQLTPDNAVFTALRIIQSKQPNSSIQLTVLRNGKSYTFTGNLGSRINSKGEAVAFLGIEWAYLPDRQFIEKYHVVEHYGLGGALLKSISKTTDYLRLTLSMFVRLIENKVALDNFGGPLTIADTAGKTLQIGWREFISFLGVMSLSLAMINLFPIPVLDGGHILLCVLEIIRRRPLSPKMINLSNQIGGAVVFAFILLVIFIDATRYLL